MAMSERVSNLRQKVLVTPSICVERACLITESYRETESDPVVIRRAKALDKILKKMTIHIEDGELIVGRATSKPRGGPILPELQWEWYLKEMDSVSTREWDRFLPLSEQEIAKMKDCLPYWNGKSIYDKWHAAVPENARKLYHKIHTGGVMCTQNQHLAHVSVDFDKVLAIGLKGIKKQIDQEFRSLNIANIEDFNKFTFLRAVDITLKAAASFAKRYARLARSMAEKEPSHQRRAELDKIAEVCNRVPLNGARTFREALQSIWFTYIAVMIEGWGYGMSFGRPDQYLYRFYKEDLEKGRITNQKARELIALLYIKLNELVTPQGSESVKTFAGFPYWPNIVIGGITKDGKDAVNELSYLFLDAELDVRLPSEDLVVRVNKNTPDSFLMKAVEVVESLRGKLKFVSDETTIQQLLSDGKPVEYARDYIIVGCNTPTVPGFSFDPPGGPINLPLILELALNNGVSRLTGEKIGPPTGDPRKFKSYDEVWDAYKKQVDALVPLVILFRNSDRQLYAELAPTPFQSALYSGCIEKGVDITNGGTAPYMVQAVSLGGAPNVGDSLAAIRKVVFEDNKIRIDRLIDALDRNFEGEGEILQMLKSAPKFGNDDDYVDSIVNDVLVHAGSTVNRYKGFAGAKCNVAAAIITANVPLGKIVGALPDGRRAGEALSEGGISPYQGRNISGPTATMRSVAKLDHIKLTNGSVLNMRFNPDVLINEPKKRKFCSLIRTFCETGGALVQFNIMSTDMLREAQKHPEKYRDLLVRVATYSAYFVELSKELQEDIIRRTEFQEL